MRTFAADIERAFWQGVCIQRAKACEALILVGQTHVDEETTLADYAANLRRWAISPDGLVVLVSGGRLFAERVDLEGNERPAWLEERKALVTTLDGLYSKFGIDLLIEGGARGADGMARLWAKKRSVPNETVKADWNAYGRAAGFRRNAEMLKLLLKYPRRLLVTATGGNGTADMVTRAVSAGIPLKYVAVSRG